MGSIIYQRIVGTFPNLNRDAVAALSEELETEILHKKPQPDQPKDCPNIEALIKDLMLLHYNLEAWDWDKKPGERNKWAVDKALTEIKRIYEALKANPTSEVEG